MTLDPTLAPDPDSGWSGTMTTLRDAIVVPPQISELVQPAGVLHADGTYCPQGALWRGTRVLTTCPDMPETPVDHLPGRWVWGGVLWVHFGHFLAESTARLWALPQIDGPLDGIVFIPKRPRVGDEIHDFQRNFIAMMGRDLPLCARATPARVEELIVPGQGFGLGQMAKGTAAFRAAIHDRFAQDIAPDGPERLYISRSLLNLKKGSVLGEEMLEQKLAENGYEVFHPQKHDIRTQIARYKAARKIVAVDGSALHMFAMVGRPDQAVAVILRRSSNVANGLIRHLGEFTGRAPTVIAALRCEWAPKDRVRSSRMSFGELDMPALGLALAGAGFVTAPADWPALDDAARDAYFHDKGLVGDKAYVRLDRPDQSPRPPASP